MYELFFSSANLRSDSEAFDGSCLDHNFKPVLDKGHDDLEGVCEDRIPVVAPLHGLDEDIGPPGLDGQPHRVLEHLVGEASLEHLDNTDL